VRLLLISSSLVHGHGYLDHAEAELRDFLGPIRRLLFVPFAQTDHDGYTARVRERLATLEVAVDGLHAAADPLAAIAGADALFVGGGNTFCLLAELQRRALLPALRARVGAGAAYIGSSAGTNLAGLTVGSTNDMPVVWPADLQALALLPFNLNPHYVDPDPRSTHMGETREARLREFHEHNLQPVLGLREPAMLRREGDALTLRGAAGARLFRRGEAPAEVAPGAGLDALLRP
jgi:dipeptidase E